MLAALRQRTQMALRPANARFMGMGGHSMEHAIGEAPAAPAPESREPAPPRIGTAGGTAPLET
jgi:hypothetical protein